MAVQLHATTTMEMRSRVCSLLLHALVVAIVLLLPQTRFDPSPKPGDVLRSVPLIAPSPLAPRVITGGGGQFDQHPATRGAIPQVIRPVFIPPSPQINEAPKLMVDSGLPDDVAIPRIDLPQIGDPLSRVSNAPPSGGRGGPAGVGDGQGRKYGDGDGPGAGAKGFPRILGTTPPQLVHKVEPEYSDEARKAKYQGAVLLAVDIDAGGRVVNVRVMRALGLGLDERAIEAVRQWRFKPALKDGRAIDFPAAIEVSFHLL